MVKELTKNPTKKFECEDVIAEVYDGNEIHFYHKITKQDFSACINDDWKEVRQSVTFKQAIEAYHNGKDIYCEFGGNRFIYKHQHYKELKNHNENPISSFEILYGIWYIA